MLVPLGIDEVNGLLPGDEIEGAGAAIKIDEVRAAAQQDVLAIVQDLAGLWILERTGPAAEGLTGFNERDLGAGGFQGQRRRHPGQAAAHHQDLPRMMRLAHEAPVTQG